MAKGRERAGEPTRAEEALRASEEKYRNIFETAPDGIVTVDLKGIVTSCNSAFTNITGFSKSEIVGKHFSKLPTLRARDIPKYMKMFTSLIRGKVPKPFEARWLHRDGTPHWAEIRVSLMKEGRKTIGFQAIERDITERKRAEEALRHSEDRYRTIFDQVPASIILLDKHGQMVDINPYHVTHIGKGQTAAKDYLGKNLVTHPSIVSAGISEMIAWVLKGQPFDSKDVYFPTTTGATDGYFNLKGVPLFKDGEVVGAVVVIEDITERKRAEEALRASENRLTLAIEATGLGIYEHAVPLGDDTYHSGRWADILGYELEELPPPAKRLEWVLEQVHPDDLLILEKTYSDFIEGRTPGYEVEIRMKHKSGEWIHVRGISHAMERDINGQVTHVLGVMEDITKHKRAEEGIRRRNEELAALNDIAIAVTSTLDLQEVLQTIQERVMESLGEIYPPLFFLFDEEDQTFNATPTRLQEEGLRRVEKLMGVNFEEFCLPLPALRPALHETLLAGKPYLTDDLSDLLERGILRRLKDVQRELEIKSIVGLPLSVKGKLVGIVVLVSPKETMPDEEIELLSAIASQAAIAIENARLYDETRRKAEELAALYDVSLDVAAQLDLDTLLKTILLRAMELLRASAGGLYLYHPERQDLELIVHQGLHKDYRGIRLALGQGACGKVAQSGEPLVVRDYANWEGRSPHFADEPTFNVLAVPIKQGDTLLGAFYVDDPDVERRFEEGDIRLATLFANQAAIAIQNARLFQQTTTRYRQLSALQKINATLRSTLPVTEVLATIAQETAKGLGIVDVLILIPDEMERRLELGAGSGGRHEEILRKVTKRLTQAFTLPLTERENAIVKAYYAGEIQRVSAEEPYLLTRGVQPRVSDRAAKLIARLMGTPEALCVPLPFGDRVMGVMVAFAIREADKEQLDLLSAIADQAGIAIENARLYEQTDEKLRDRVAELTALNAIAQSLASTLQLDEMLESIVTRVAQMMQTRICTIRLLERNELTIGAAVGYRDESSRQHTIKIDKRLARIVRDQQPLLVEDLWETEDIPPSRRMRAWREEVHSFLGVPMISKGKTIGVLSLYGEKPHRFTEEDVSLLLTIANQAAIAIESARPYERAREHAEELERLVQERTRELQAIHAELLQSAKLAALGQLAAGVAHELNNPLGAISGYLELLQEETELAPRETEYVQRIEKRIQQATKIVGELRSVGIPSEPVWQIVNVNDILEETLALVERRLSLHQIKVQKEITPDMPLMHADPDRLGQVFINLITNARQAMKEGGTLRVTCRESRNGEWVEIIFADTGEGIAKHHLNKIFDPFFTTRSPGEAMGLGLSITHRHIKDHGGAIDVWSEKGRGTVFRIVLPPSGAKRCWEIIDCDEKERCGAVRENAEYRCWSVMEDVSRCERCEVYRRKALSPLDGTLLPE